MEALDMSFINQVTQILESQFGWAILCLLLGGFILKKVYQKNELNETKIISLYEINEKKAQMREDKLMEHLERSNESQERTAKSLEGINDSKGNALWNAYNTTNANKVINYAKSIGFESGRDWGWDAPHLQYEYKGYGTDTFTGIVNTQKKYNLGYDVPKDTSKAFRLHTTAFKNKAESEKAKVDYVKNGYLAYAEVFGNDKDGYRLQSGKYISQKDAEKVAMRLIDVGLQDYVSIIGRPN